MGPGYTGLCGDEANFNKGASKKSTFFLNRGFPSSVVDRVLNQVRPISRTSTLTPSLPSRNSDKGPLILTYHRTNIHIQKIIRCHFHHLQQDATTRHILLPSFVCLPQGLFPPGHPGPHFLHPQNLPTALWHLP
eukprot:g28812.t1